MHLPTFSILVLALAVSSSTAAPTSSSFPTMYIGNIARSCGSASIKGGQYDLWFADSNVCTKGVSWGAPSYFSWLCKNPDSSNSTAPTFAIEGYSGITFSDCPPIKPYGTPGLPQKVHWNGAHVLNCKEVKIGDFTCSDDCPTGFNYGYPSTVRVQMKCTPVDSTC